MKIAIKILITASLFMGYTAISQTVPQALAKINTEGFQKSEVMNLITDLSEINGNKSILYSRGMGQKNNGKLGNGQGLF
jgi:hypothetical protein